MASWISFFHAAFAILFPVVIAQSNFDYSQQPIPIPFLQGNSYPNRPETDVCRPIFNHVLRNSARFTNELVFNTNPHIKFATTDSRRMTSRMQTRLDRLREIYSGGFTVLKTWTQYPDSEVPDPSSLHYEGRTVRVSVTEAYRTSEFLTNAIQAAFDWVIYDNEQYIRLSVIPDSCENNVDMVFVLDQSGSVGSYNHGLAIQFILNVIQFFSISLDATRVGFVAFSRYSHIEFELDEYTSAESLANRISNINYRGGATATALGLNDTSLLLNPINNRGARSTSEGVPKVAILITDGKSNRHPLTYAVPYIKSLGVQVYALGIANPDVQELQFIASDPDSEHVFLLNSYNDAAGFVDFLSIQTCDTPAIIDPGENTTTEVPEDGVRYFQVQCDSFSDTVLVELYDNIGTSFLYCSATEQNPGPLTSNTVVDTRVGVTTRSCIVSLANTNSKVVYIGVQGVDEINQFTVVVWDLLFTPDEDDIIVLEGETGIVYDVSMNLNSGANEITFQYHIVDGDYNDVFRINENGRVRVPSQGLVFDDGSFYNLLIVAENVVDSCQRSRFKLGVRVGRNEIIFPTLAPVSVSETATVGTEVTTIVATGGAGQIEYSLIGPSSPFTIEPTTGKIVVNEMLNFEDEMQYSVIVQAEGVGTIVSGSATQIINIDDVNEQPQWVIECSLTDECMAVLQENLSPRDIGIRLEATDADLPSVPNGQLIYRIVSNDPQFPFSINDNGQIQTTQLLDRENREMHTFTVIAADGGNPSLSVSTTFRVMVTDVNDEPPVFIQGPETISLPENEPTDTVIAQYITTDRDTPPNARVTYTLAPSSNLPFELNSDDGVLTNSEKIDYENPDTRVFTIVVTADNPPLSSMTTTLIQIMDVNDNEPVFDQNSYSFSVPEHSDNNTAVGSVTATDADSGLNGAVYYSITAGNSQGYFSIDEITGEIIVSADIDRELVGSVELKVRAKDRGSPNLLSTVMVTVTISDINDNPPIFNPEVYFVSVREDISTNSQVITVFATDADKPNTDNSRIVYSIQSGNTGGVFRIDDTSGVVVLINPLNHENISSYTLTIRADDQGIPQLSDNAIVEVTVINVNEAPPILSGDQTIDVSESTPTGVIVASFSASDPDFMTVSISILSGNDEGRFQINSDGDISIAIMLDFETTETYTLTIEASDGESTDLASLFVNVLDENEFTPEFFGDTLFILNEEVDNGTLVGTITANDGDGSAPNNVVTYSFAMQNSIEDYFFLDGSSGRITTADVLDREMLTNVFPLPSSSLSIQVFARDGGSPSLQSSRVYTITLLDINDNNPEFGNDDYSNSIFENQPPQVVMSFTATDSDLGENAEIHFSFTVEPIEGATLFDLGDDSIGEISTTQGLDCEIQTSYIFTLTATDRGTPRRSASITSTLTLRDQNDNSPIFTEDPYIFMVDENIAANSIVGQVIANDTDKGVNGEVFYEIIGQDEDDLEEEGEIAGGTLPFFEIDSDTGEIQHVTPFDFESFPTVNITIKANDRGTPRQSSITMVIFNITNVDEFGPRFTSSCDDVSLSENTPINTVIVNCMAIDLDNTTTADDTEWITYSIISGNTDDTFSIGLNDGIIRNAIELDYETNSFFRLTVIATDGNELSRRRIIDIIIEDENDNAPTFQMRSFSLAMTSEAIESNTQMIARARAIDDDSGSNGDVQYSIDDDDIVRVSETETQVTITARDGGDKPQTATATLKVTFDEECLLQKYTVDPNTGVVMTQVLCSVEVRPVSTDVVVGDNHTAYCHIVRNSPAKYQWLLNGNAIDLTVFLPDEDQEAILNVESVGFQDAGSYACKVTTEAGSLQTATYTINILVIPVITVVTRPTAVLENDFVKFSCFAVGTPTPMIHWEYQGRIVGTGNTITIEKADESTQGNYSCVAVSSAGSTNQDTRLIVYVTENVAEIVIRNVDQPSPDGTCHYLDPEAIESVLSSSGMSTMITDILAENVCEINSCSPNPCNNGGRCQLDDNVEGGYSCTCANGYTGVNCIEDVDECLDGPCGPSGECRNVRGLFQCMCTDSTGNRCQYSTICIDVNNICNDGELCMESLESLSGYTCIVPNSDELLSVIVTEIDVGFLDDIIVNYREALLQQQQQATDNQIKRATEESLIMFAQNNCNPRFLQLDPRDDNLFGLFWDCPDGEFSPPVNIQSVLCEILVESRLVVSCQAANMSLLIRPTLPPSLPKISVTIQLIQVDSDTGEPLSIGKTLNNLQDIAEEFAKSEILPGAEVDSVSAVIPIVCTSKCVNGECTDRDMCTCNDGWTADVCDIKQQELDQEESSTSTGVIVGVVVALVVCIILVIVAAIVLYIVITKHCEHQKRQELKKKYARELNEMNLSTLPSTSPTKTNSAAPPLHTGSTEMINSNLNKSTDMLVEDNDYDQLPALVKPSTVQPDTDNDYDQLPAMVNKSVPKEN